MKGRVFSSYITLGISGVFLLTAVIDSAVLAGGEKTIFGGVFTFILLFASAAFLIFSLVIKKPSCTPGCAGFYMLHGGLVLFLVGALVFAVSGKDVTVSVPVDTKAIYSQVQSSEGEMIGLEFGLGVSDFEYQSYSAEKDGTDAPKYYEATLMLRGKSGNVRYQKLAVNSPVRISGWKILLMGCDTAEGSVTLLLKRNPGEFVSLAGIAVTIAGAFLFCFSGKRRAGERK